MSKLKIMTILGTRPEIIRLSETIKACDKAFNHILVHTGQNYDYELNEIFFEELNLRKPDYFLSCAGKDLGQTMGNVLSKSYEVLLNEKPDAVIILGDTNSALSAISAKRLHIPVVHLEAGNRCFNPLVPEELNRKIVDHISDFNLPYTNISKGYLLKEGIDESMIFVTGSPMKEVIQNNISKINDSKILDKLNLQKQKYVVVSMHREENLDRDDEFISLINLINSVAIKYNCPVVFSTHPRTKKRLDNLHISLNPLVQSIKPLGLIDYLKLQINSMIVLSDSGTLTEESYMCQFPAIILRNCTERPEGILAESIMLYSKETDKFYKQIDFMISRCNNHKCSQNNKIEEYEIDNFSSNVINFILRRIKA